MQWIQLENAYGQLPDVFYQRIDPVPVRAPHLLFLNQPLADQMGLSLDDHLHTKDGANVFSGNSRLPGSEPLAQAYAGHQFGHFVPQLGDGRAVLLGDFQSPAGGRYDLQLKGSGPTRFSRRGDGRAALGPMLREVLISEFMHAIGIPTTRALAVTLTGEWVQRERAFPGAILARVARHHVRVGTFEYFAARGDFANLQNLIHYLNQRDQSSRSPIEFVSCVVKAQAELIAQWMGIGFIHGVMNTDNMSLASETIDYGPCAFMDQFHSRQVFSSIDHQGRYAFDQQPSIAAWNLRVFVSCLLPLFSPKRETAEQMAHDLLATFDSHYTRAWDQVSQRKFAFPQMSPVEVQIRGDFYKLLEKDDVDLTTAFVSLEDESGLPFVSLFQDRPAAEAWHQRWKKVIFHKPWDEVKKQLQAANPKVIPRNHWVELVLGDLTEKASQSFLEPSKINLQQFESLLQALRNPFSAPTDSAPWMKPPAAGEKVCQTFCGT